jgi:hypothetical protein
MQTEINDLINKIEKEAEEETNFILHNQIKCELFDLKKVVNESFNLINDGSNIDWSDKRIVMHHYVSVCKFIKESRLRNLLFKKMDELLGLFNEYNKSIME